MHTRKTDKSRKAISPILATLLLIVIAVAAIVVTYAWIMTYMSNAGQQAEVRITNANVDFQNNPKKIIIDMINTGTARTDILRLYIGNSQSTEQAQNTTIPVLPTALVAGATVSFSVNYNWTAGATYYFKVISSSGQSPEWPEQAPS
jgi:flagellin-like protein